jgi:hypothetical protein
MVPVCFMRVSWGNTSFSSQILIIVNDNFQGSHIKIVFDGSNKAARFGDVVSLSLLLMKLKNTGKAELIIGYCIILDDLKHHGIKLNSIMFFDFLSSIEFGICQLGLNDSFAVLVFQYFSNVFLDFAHLLGSLLFSL